MKKKVLATILSLSLPFLLMACTDSNKEENLSNKPTIEEESNNNTTTNDEKNNEDIDNADNKDEVKEEDVKLYYYDVITDKIVYINKTISIEGKAVGTALVNALKESPNSDISPSIADEVTLKSAKLDKENDTISLDFSANFISAQNLGSGAESKTLTAICNTFGDYYDVNNVIITIEGNTYSSGHILMNEGEAFKVNLEDTSKL
ncbi:MAG: GerMN domain-containing protein [Clostridium sp.]|uniref:GerMN domain-containing protein n=1 Tax=Clostridium sp. TaxID=1506 RepID=UPI00290A39EB|nr:GerMN domain-containing protein [Clostridium sp.]MDU5111572.1 GerMN domain-containing protein [Clostridium sp.]